MKENETEENYILTHIDPEGDYLHRLWRATNIHLLAGRMASGHLQGRLLRMLVRMIRPKRILEVGTFSGYSAICMAEALDPGVSPLGKKIRLIIGDAKEVISGQLSAVSVQSFDLVFIDADKREYCAYWELVYDLVRPGGWILADNTLWDGHVLQSPRHADRQTQAIRQFNDFVAADQRVERVILPLRDGLTLIRKR